MIRWCPLMFSCLLTVANTTFADTLKLTSLLWPPYSGYQLQHQGASVAVAKAAFEQMEQQLIVDFYPWSRAIKLAVMPGSDYIGYFPEYYFETDKFIFSKPIGIGPLGIVEQKSRPISWHHLADLNRYTLGIVQDYVNTDSLDVMIASGSQPVEAATSDEQNIKKVAAGRIDGAVIDINVLHYLLKQPHLQPLADKLQVNRQLIANKQLYVAFRNTEEGRRWRDIFDQGLAKLDIDSIMGDLLFKQEALSQ